LDFVPQQPKDFAGIICFHDDNCYIRFGKTLDKDGKPVMLLETYSHGRLCSQAGSPLTWTDGKVYLKVEGDNAVNYTFCYSTSPKGSWTQVGEPVSADLISTQTAGGFTGTMVGIYATGNYTN
jgi:beta-xylosidase